MNKEKYISAFGLLSTLLISGSLFSVGNRFAVAEIVNGNPSNTVIGLNGRWTAGGIHSAVISKASNSLTIDMSAFNRPTAHGSILDASTIMVKFPDDRTYTGKLVPPDKIKWSNGSTWRKVKPEG